MILYNFMFGHFHVVVLHKHRQNNYTLGIAGFLGFVHCLVFYKTITNTTFRKLDLIPSSDDGWETHSMVGHLERANLSHCTTYDSKVNV
jgi:hypothetical protein